MPELIKPIENGATWFGTCVKSRMRASGIIERGPMLRTILLLVLSGVAMMNAQQPGQKAAPKKSKAETVNYYRDIEPILTANCASCHQAAMAAGGLRVDAPENVLQGGASGPAVVPGKAQRSLLYMRLTDTTAKRMPPVGMLTEEQLALIRAWINAGAKIDPAPSAAKH